MPRRKNTKPTAIYWLLDIRPEVIASGQVQGQPFYAGKTVQKTETRLKRHLYAAVKKPYGKVGARILECGEHVRIATLEIVPVEGDWVAREKHWIAFSRRLYPDIMVNVTEGGQGSPGVIPSAKALANMRDAQNRPEVKAKASATSKAMWADPPHRAKASAAMKAALADPVCLAKRTAAWKSAMSAPEARARRSTASKAVWADTERRARLSADKKAVWADPAHRAKMSARAKAVWAARRA